jgi:hypothetical protein
MLELATNALGEWTSLDARSLELRVNQLLFRSILDVLLLSYVPNGANLVFHVKKVCISRVPSFSPSYTSIFPAIDEIAGRV